MRPATLGLILRRAYPAPWLMVAGWIGLLLQERQLALPSLCGSLASSLATGGTSLQMALWLNPPLGLLLSWLCMLLAMMPPLIAPAAWQLWWQSLARRRWIALAVFLLAYLAVWTVAGVLLIGLSILLRLLPLGLPMLVPAILLTLLWQISPAKQGSLNRCHRRPALSVFGWAAVRSWARHGLTSGLWCVGSCWPLMLPPMMAGDAHLPAMAVVTLWLWYERLLPARPAQWGGTWLRRQLSRRPVVTRRSATPHCMSKPVNTANATAR